MPTQSSRLAKLRKSKSLSQEQLAAKTKAPKVHPRTIQRLERSDEALAKARPTVLQRLAEALGVEVGVLTGALPMPDDADAPIDVFVNRVQLGAKVSPAARNAYTLVAMHYSVTQASIAEMAPLFFVLLAEMSFKRLQTLLGELRERVAALTELTDGSYLLMASPYMAPEMIAAVEKLLDGRDLFGKQLWAAYEKGRFDVDPDEWDNPFVAYLRGLTEEIGDPALVAVRGPGATDPFDLPDYELCRSLAQAIADGDEKIENGVVNGNVLLHEIPSHLRGKDAKEARMRWLREKVEQTEKRHFEFVRSLFDDDLPLDLPPTPTSNGGEKEDA